MRDHRLVKVCLLLLFFAGRGHAWPQQPAPPLQLPLDPAGDVILRADGAAAEGSLPVTILRSPDASGPGGGGRYLVVVNSGYGVQLAARANEGQQLLQVIDLNATPARRRAGGVFPVAAERQCRCHVRPEAERPRCVGLVRFWRVREPRLATAVHTRRCPPPGSGARTRGRAVRGRRNRTGRDGTRLRRSDLQQRPRAALSHRARHQFGRA